MNKGWESLALLAEYLQVSLGHPMRILRHIRIFASLGTELAKAR